MRETKKEKKRIYIYLRDNYVTSKWRGYCQGQSLSPNLYGNITFFL